MRQLPALLTMSCIALALTAGLSGCKKKKPPPAAVAEGAVIIRHFDADLSSRFAFAKTIGQILSTAGIADTPANREALVKTMFQSFNSSSFTNPASGLAMTITPRGSDAAIPAAQLLDPNSPVGLKPIGLFNRLDLAPKDWSDCGEHRIVFAGGPRIFVIFEAKLPNPDPAAGKQGCRAVAQRWADVSTAPTPTKRNELLDEFYFAGMPGFRKVVHFLNYGAFLGQVRTNILGQNPWQLREFRVLPVAPQQIVFLPAPVANNPLSSFYRDNPVGSPLEQSERTAFQAKFASDYLNNLRSIDATEAAAATEAEFKRKLMNGVGAGFDFRFDEFQSDSQIGNQVPAVTAGTTIKGSIPLTWDAPIGTRRITQEEILNRAGAVTCGGCHGLSSGRPIGSFNNVPITWPAVAPGGFVHISEQLDGTGGHQISQALTEFFIPFRQDVTNDVLNTTTAMLHGAGKSKAMEALIPSAHAQPATGGLPSREQAENVATALASGRVGEADARDDAVEVRRVSDQAHAADQVKPGAYVEFRRPH